MIDKGGEIQSEAESKLRIGDYKRRMDGDSTKRKNENITAITVSEVHFSEEESEPHRDEVSLRTHTGRWLSRVSTQGPLV